MVALVKTNPLSTGNDSSLIYSEGGTEIVGLAGSNGVTAKILSPGNDDTATWWHLRGLPAGYIGVRFFKDVGVGGSFWYSDGYAWNPCSPIILFSGVNLICPADTALNNLFKKLIPGDLMGLDRELVFDGLFSFSNSANAKTLTLTAGSYAAPTIIGTTAPTANASINFSHKWGNTGVANSQSYFPSLSSPYAITASAMSSSSLDTSYPFHIGANIQMANAGDTAKINRLTVTLR